MKACSEHVQYSWNNFLECKLLGRNKTEDAAPCHKLFEHRRDRLFRLPATLCSTVNFGKLFPEILTSRCTYFRMFSSLKYVYFFILSDINIYNFDDIINWWYSKTLFGYALMTKVCLAFVSPFLPFLSVLFHSWLLPFTKYPDVSRFSKLSLNPHSIIEHTALEGIKDRGVQH